MKKREIILPQELDNKLDGILEQLVGLKQEVNGVLLYLPLERSDYIKCRVDKLYPTGVGVAGHVKADQKRMDIINGFFEMHPEYRYIKWHTHSKGTGNQWYKKLSKGDLVSYQEQMEMDPEFIGMMVSPVKKIIVAGGKGEGNTILRVVPTWSDFYERQKYLNDEIRRAAESLGYDNIPKLKATRRIKR